MFSKCPQNLIWFRFARKPNIYQMLKYQWYCQIKWPHAKFYDGRTKAKAMRKNALIMLR